MDARKSAFSCKEPYSASILSFRSRPLGLILPGVLHVTVLQSLWVHIVAKVNGPMHKYMLQSKPYSARGHFCQCCKACVHIVAKVFVLTCCSRSRTVPGATSASVAKRVCPHCCKSVCAYMLQSEPYSARGHFCQCCKVCVSTLLQKCLCLHVAVGAYSARGHYCQCCKACVSTLLQKCLCLHVALGAVQCPGPLVPVLQSVCVHIVANVYGPMYMLQ
jgi:hypothetical protein